MKNILSIVALIGLGALVYNEYQKAKKKSAQTKVG